MTYNYKCSNCKDVSEVEISMANMTNANGRIEVEKLDAEIYGRKCGCGGELNILIQPVDFSFKEKGKDERARKMAEEFSHFDD